MNKSSEQDEKQSAEEQGEGDSEQPVPSDDEDDCEGYFLEPVGNNVDIAEKIAEANRKLLEETEEGEGDKTRPRKVQFSEELVNFEPNYYSDDDYTQSAQNSIISEEDLCLKTSQPVEPKNENFLENGIETNPNDDIPEEIAEEVVSDIIEKEIINGATEMIPKFILVLLPKEQNSSCESIIGEEIPEDKNEIKEPEPEKPVKTKMARPKSAKKTCEMSKISPTLGYTSNMDRKAWQTCPSSFVRPKSKMEATEEKKEFVGEIKVQIKQKVLKKINVDHLNLENVAGLNLKKCSGNRPRSCYIGRNNLGDENRPMTAPMRRTCCVVQTELPQYNGLRSEYGLSAEQLQERKQKALDSRLKKKQEQIKKRQDEVNKQNENEEIFRRWLFNKSKKTFKKKTLKLRDTLTRSDVYIQTHASYAANRNVPYSLDYNFSKKLNNSKRISRVKKNKTIAVEKLFENMTPHFKRSFNIYLGIKS